MTNTSALSYQGSAEVKFTFNPTLSINISSSDLVIDNLTPGTTGTSNEISVNVSTNNVYGYSLYATVGNSTNNSANLTHTNNAYTFTSISTAANLPSLTTDSTWGYTYSLDSGTTWSNYNGLPLYSSTGARLKKTTELSEDTINFKIAAKSSPTQASGTYANVINFTAITNLAPLSLAESYAAYYQKTGKTKLDGYYVMQDMNKEICDNAEIIDSELQVIDNRDHKIYWIAKLKDNHCWMTQNLDLDLISDPTAENYVALTSENTDLNEYGDHNYTSQYGYSIDSSDVITWLPTNTTIAFTGANIDNWVSSASVPSSASKTDDINTGHYIHGNWYNWPAAIASNSASSYYNSMANSICPKNWKLPESEYCQIVEKYNITHSIAYRLKEYPLYFVQSGDIYLGRNRSVNVNGYYWTNNRLSLYFLNNWVNATYSNSTIFGQSVRCLAR